jgi:shikimate dehydrogenase
MNLFGLIGYPLGHSFSKQYFTNKFETEGLEDCFFDLFPLEDIATFPDLISTHSSLKGLAVTIPYKETVIPFLHQISAEAKKIGAVNCIKIHEGHFTGYNTDIIGFEKSFTPLLEMHHTKALILGTGGASKAVQFILNKLQIPFLLVLRTADNISRCITYADMNESLLKEFTIIINCTPVGMAPKEDAKPLIPYEFISSKHYLYDLIYKPATTLFLEEGKSKGAIVKNGYEMLLIQAEENWKIWQGV